MYLRPRTLFHPPDADPGTAPDVIASAQDGPGPRFFVPARLPCGECPRCRRGHAAVCERSTSPFATWRPGDPAPDVPDRFITALDIGGEPCPLTDVTAAWAGRVALVLDAVSRAGLSPGDLAVWAGDSHLARLGAWVSRERGAQSLWLSQTAQAESAIDDGPQALLADGARALADLTTAPNLPAAHGLGDTKFFLCNLPTAETAIALVPPGSTLSLVGPFRHGIPDLRRLSMGKILVTTDYHPDLIPEALALMTRHAPHLGPALLSLFPSV